MFTSQFFKLTRNIVRIIWHGNFTALHLTEVMLVTKHEQ